VRLLTERCLVLHPFTDPTINVALSIPKVTAHLEAGGALSAVPPGVERGNWYLQVGGEVLDREQWIEGAHSSTVHDDPVSGMPNRCHSGLGKIPNRYRKGTTGKSILQAHSVSDREIGGFLTGLLTLC
jgi:hypothetical protein